MEKLIKFLNERKLLRHYLIRIPRNMSINDAFCERENIIREMTQGSTFDESLAKRFYDANKEWNELIHRERYFNPATTVGTGGSLTRNLVEEARQSFRRTHERRGISFDRVIVDESHALDARPAFVQTMESEMRLRAEEINRYSARWRVPSIDINNE
jgi:hypothetical protein